MIIFILPVVLAVVALCLAIMAIPGKRAISVAVSFLSFFGSVVVIGVDGLQFLFGDVSLLSIFAGLVVIGVDGLQFLFGE